MQQAGGRGPNKAIHNQRGNRSTPPAETATDVIDTTKRTVRMVIGGKTSVPANTLFFDRP
jgi:hypothetical protein